jgi:hypothetical protein
MVAQPKARAPALPVVISEWRRGDRERIRIVLADDVVDIRPFFRGDDDEPLRPGKTGIALPIAHIPALAAGLAKALIDARARGLID